MAELGSVRATSESVLGGIVIAPHAAPQES